MKASLCSGRYCIPAKLDVSVVEDHGYACNCWECEGREPDAQNDYRDRGYGSCAYCGDALGREDVPPVHDACGSAFMRYLVES